MPSAVATMLCSEPHDTLMICCPCRDQDWRSQVISLAACQTGWVLQTEN